MMKPPFLASDKNPPVAGLVPVPELCGEDDEDTACSEKCRTMQKGICVPFSWCMDVRGAYYGGGVVTMAREAGAMTIALTGFSRSPLTEVSDHCLVAGNPVMTFELDSIPSRMAMKAPATR